MKPFLSPPPWDAAKAEFWEAWQLRRLREFLKRRVLPFSGHYRQLFDQHGIRADDLRAWSDWSRVPFTDKTDLTASRERLRDFVLQPSQRALKREPRVIVDALLHGRARAREQLEAEFRPILLTSTTGRSSGPVPFVFTKHDLANLETAGRRIMEVGRSDQAYRHVNLFPYAPHLAFWQAHYAGLGFGTFMLSTGGGKSLGTDGNITLIERTRPDVIIGMPTFIYHVLQQAVAEKRKWTDIKRVVLGGEKVPPGLRAKLRALCSELGSLGVHVISIYGFTEAKMAFPECPTMPHEGASGFHLYPDLARIEIINPQTGDTVPPGAPGEIVFTPLAARGTVVLRYRTGDIAEGGLSWDPCPHCGRACPRLIGPISRVSEQRLLNLEKLKGTLVDFNVLEHLLDDQRGLASWQIELRKRNDDPLECDEVILHVAAEPGMSEGSLREQIARRLHEATELRPNAIFFHPLPKMRELLGIGRMLKEERIADHRARTGSAPPPPDTSKTQQPLLA